MKNLFRQGSLRLRIIGALALIVTTTGTLFAFGVLELKQQLEQVIFDDLVRGQLSELLEQEDAGHHIEERLFRNWVFYRAGSGAEVPATLAHLQNGSHHSVEIDDRYYQVEVANHKGEQVFLTYDITAWEHQEHELLQSLAWGILILLLVALIMGHEASKTILAPVRAFTSRLTAIHPGQRYVRMAADFSGNEIGQIATAFDQYQERLDYFVERERSFTAAASHELRTPLSIIVGALDVLGVEQQLGGASSRAIDRIRRACDEMRGFIEATLFLSREENTTIQDDSPCDVIKVVNELVSDTKELLLARNTTIDLALPSELQLSPPASIVKILVGNLLRNAIEHTENGRITLALSEHSLKVSDNGAGIKSDDIEHVFDFGFTTKREGAGLGLNLVKRICDRYGWKVDIQSQQGSGTTVTVLFQFIA